MISLLPKIAVALTLAAGPCDGPADLPPETFWEKAARVAGFSSNPSALRGPGDQVGEGDVVLWFRAGKTPVRRPLTQDGGYRSPIFQHGDRYVLALKGKKLVRVPVAGGDVKELFDVPDVVKLVGASRDEEHLVLAVAEDAEGRRSAAFVCLGTGRVVTFGGDANTDESHLPHLLGWWRQYEKARVETRDRNGRSNVFLVRDGGEIKVSRCKDVHCGQPSLSSDGERVVYLKAR